MARYMMATRAFHGVKGYMGRKKSDLCVIHSEDKMHFIGNWVTGAGFINVKFPKKTTRDLTEEEKNKWHGKKVVIVENPIAFRAICMEEVERIDTKESPMIVLPEDETRRQQLRAKLVEYQGRIDPYRGVEMQMDTICKMAVLGRLLRDGKVNTWDVCREMAETYGSGFDGYGFSWACGTIKDYCETGGQNVHGGTGLGAPR